MPRRSNNAAHLRNSAASSMWRSLGPGKRSYSQALRVYLDVRVIAWEPSCLPAAARVQTRRLLGFSESWGLRGRARFVGIKSNDRRRSQASQERPDGDMT